MSLVEKSQTIYERLRLESLSKYYKDPKICKKCSGVIWVPDGKRVSEIKKKAFCSPSCKSEYQSERTANRDMPVVPKKKVVRVSDITEALKPIAKETPAPRDSFFKKHKIKQKNKRQSVSNAGTQTLRKCDSCGEDYDVAARWGQPGKVTVCENCMDESEEKYHGNWVPVGASTGSNLHQWGLVPVKGGERHVGKTSVG